MSKIAIGVGILVAAAGGALWLNQRADHAALRREIGLMRQEMRQVAERKSSEPLATVTVAPENPVARDSTTELAALRKTTQEMVSTVQAATKPAENKAADNAMAS